MVETSVEENAEPIAQRVPRERPEGAHPICSGKAEHYSQDAGNALRIR
jgi:hypothetical protein